MYKEEKKGEFIGRSDLSITDLWLVDGLVASASHSLGLLPLPYLALRCSEGCQASTAMVFKF